MLLTEVGASRKLTAQAFDSAGNPVGGSPTWSSNDPATVEVAADGTLTARAIGSAQVTASVDGVTSAPALVVVATPVAGAILVSDEQIVGEPVVTDANADTYQVTLTGLSPKVGDVLIGTGGKPLGGRVAAVDGQTATMELVPPGELVTDLELTEVIDLSRAPIQIPADIARLVRHQAHRKHARLHAQTRLHAVGREAVGATRQPSACRGRRDVRGRRRRRNLRAAAVRRV